MESAARKKKNGSKVHSEEVGDLMMTSTDNVESATCAVFD